MAKKKEKKPTPSRIGSRAQNLFEKPAERRDIFSNEPKPTVHVHPTNPEPTSGESKGPGRPKKFDDNKKKTTVSLQLEKIVWLDRLCTDILSNTKSVIDRGDIIRACIEALHESGIDLSHITSPASIKEHILHKLKS
jgi:hypothetical protein